MQWRKEEIHGAVLIERWDTTLPNIGMLRVERQHGRKLNDRIVWRVVCYDLSIRHDIVADGLEDAQQQALAFVQARLAETLEALSHGP